MRNCKSNLNRILWWALVAICSLAVSTAFQASSARAGFTVQSGAVTVLTPPFSPPLNLREGQTVSTTNMFAFQEYSNFTLPVAANIDVSGPGTYKTVASLTPGTIAAGTTVDSYFFHTDAPLHTTVPSIYNVTVHFDLPILGIQALTRTLQSFESPAPFGANLGRSDVIYPVPADLFSGLEFQPNGPDFLVEQLDSQTLVMHFSTKSNPDEIRVFTVIPEPASMTLAFAGAITLGTFAIRRRKGKRVA